MTAPQQEVIMTGNSQKSSSEEVEDLKRRLHALTMRVDCAIYTMTSMLVGRSVGWSGILGGRPVGWSGMLVGRPVGWQACKMAGLLDGSPVGWQACRSAGLWDGRHVGRQAYEMVGLWDGRYMGGSHVGRMASRMACMLVGADIWFASEKANRPRSSRGQLIWPTYRKRASPQES